MIALFHVIVTRLMRALGLAVVLALALAAVAPAAVLNLQAARQRSRADTYSRCSVFAEENYPRIDAVSLGSCFRIHVSPCKYTILSARRAKCWTEFETHELPTGRKHWICTQMLYWKGKGNAITLYRRSRQKCDQLDGPA